MSGDTEPPVRDRLPSPNPRQTVLLLTAVGLAALFVAPVSFLLVWGGLYALSVLWLFFGRRPEHGGNALQWAVQMEPAPADVLFLGAGAKALWSGKVRSRFTLAGGLLVAFVALNVLQLTIVQDLTYGLWFTGATGYTIGLALLFATVLEEGLWPSIRRFYVVGVVVASAIIVVLFVLRMAGVAGELSPLYRGTRVQGFFKDPNVAGPFVVTGALLGLSRVMVGDEWVRSVSGALLAGALAATLFTFSRGAVLNLAAGVVVLLGVAAWQGRTRRALTIGAGAALVALAVLIPVAWWTGQLGRLQGLTVYDQLGRFSAWKAGVAMILDNPLGVGPGQFNVLSPEYQLAMGTPETRVVPGAHNTYIRVFAENGIFGFALFMMAVAIVLKFGIQLARVASRQGIQGHLVEASWLLAALVGVLVESLVVDTLHWRHLWIVAGFVMGLHHMRVRTGAGSRQTG